MCTTQCMLTLLIAEVGLPTVVNSSSSIIFQHRVFRFQCLPAPFLVDEQVSVERSGRNMKPVQTFLNPHTRFVKVNNISRQNSSFDLLRNRFEALIYTGIGRQNSAFIERTVPHITHQLLNFFQRQLVIIIQKYTQCLNPGAVLYGLSYLRWKTSHVLPTATYNGAQLMFRDFQPGLGYVEHLTLLEHFSHIRRGKNL